MNTEELENMLNNSLFFGKKIGEYLDCYILLGFDHTGNLVLTRKALTEKDDMALDAATKELNEGLYNE